MREADDDGNLPFATDFDEGCKHVWKLISVQPNGRRMVARCIRELVDGGALLHVGDRLTIKDLAGDVSYRVEGG